MLYLQLLSVLFLGFYSCQFYTKMIIEGEKMEDNIVYLDNAATTMPKFFAVRGDNLWGNANTPYAINEIIIVYGTSKTIFL